LVSLKRGGNPGSVRSIAGQVGRLSPNGAASGAATQAECEQDYERQMDDPIQLTAAHLLVVQHPRRSGQSGAPMPPQTTV
jgi:hypothetical protein